MTTATGAEHFHAICHVSVPCFDEATLADVAEVLSRTVTGLAIAHGVEPITSIDFPHQHSVNEDEDEAAQP